MAPQIFLANTEANEIGGPHVSWQAITTAKGGTSSASGVQGPAARAPQVMHLADADELSFHEDHQLRGPLRKRQVGFMPYRQQHASKPQPQHPATEN